MSYIILWKTLYEKKDVMNVPVTLLRLQKLRKTPWSIRSLPKLYDSFIWNTNPSWIHHSLAFLKSTLAILFMVMEFKINWYLIHEWLTHASWIYLMNVFHRKQKVIQVWKDMRVSKGWQYCNFWLNYSFKYLFPASVFEFCGNFLPSSSSGALSHMTTMCG